MVVGTTHTVGAAMPNLSVLLEDGARTTPERDCLVLGDPQLVEFWAELPMTATGKVLKRELR